MRKWTAWTGLALLAIGVLVQERSLSRGDGPRFTTNRESPVELSLPAEDESYSFAVFGDRTGGPVDGIEILAEAVDDVNAIGPDLVMTVGDLINGYNTTEPWMRQMREFQDTMGELNCDWFPVAGNHDTYWRGPGKPKGEHDANYEKHFGPLWYAFRHKTAWFIVLYSDEGNPETGEKNFSKPSCQRISEEQFAWLDETLATKTGAAEHVFVFIHHPRWKGGQYGDDWNRVHERLVAAGNVSAVFAGHIHAMTYDGVRDGIEYFTLATVGGFLDAELPEAGFLHHFELVTVRESGIDVASIPVGEVLDPRLVTTEVNLTARRLHRDLNPVFAEALDPFSTSADSQVVRVSLKNPVSMPVELTLTPNLGDPRRTVSPDHVHKKLEPGATFETSFTFGVRGASPVDLAYRVPELVIKSDLLAPGIRVSVGETVAKFPHSLRALPEPSRPSKEHALELNGSASSYIPIPSDRIQLDEGPFTLETWVYFEGFEARQGLLAKTENSEFGIFVSRGKPEFFLHVGGEYVTAAADGFTLPTRRWVHVAGVYDGVTMSLYVDGGLIGGSAASGRWRRNSHPLILGGDVDGSGKGTSLTRGQLDEVRLSSVARYDTLRFEPQRRHEADESTVLLYHMDPSNTPWLFDSSSHAVHVPISDSSSIVEASN